MSKFNKVNIRIGLVQGFYWMASCVFVSFLVRLLAGFGYSDYECGIALSVSAFATLIVQPLIGKTADYTGKVSLLIVGCFVVSSLSAMLLIPFHSNRVLSYLLIFIIFGSFRSLIYIIDLWSYGVGDKAENFSYGFTRSFGAVFYALSAPFYGSAIDNFGTGIIIPCFIVMSVISAFMVVIVPKTEIAKKEKTKTSLNDALKLLLSNKNYIVLLISYTLIEMSAIPEQNYLTRKFEVLGNGELYTGVSLLVMGLLQIPVLNSMDKISAKVRSIKLIWVSLFGIFLRNIILAFSKTAIGTVCCYLTEPFAFGLYIGAIMLYMHEYLHPEVIYFGMTLYSAITSGLGGIIGNYIAGVLSQNHGIINMLKLMTIPAAVGFVLFSVFLGLRSFPNKD